MTVSTPTVAPEVPTSGAAPAAEPTTHETEHPMDLDRPNRPHHCHSDYRASDARPIRTPAEAFGATVCYLVTHRRAER